jgi:hypothetical protein
MGELYITKSDVEKEIEVKLKIIRGLTASAYKA